MKLKPELYMCPVCFGPIKFDNALGMYRCNSGMHVQTIWTIGRLVTHFPKREQ